MTEQTNEINRPTLFGQPRIAEGVVYLVVTVILTHAAALLMSQPAAYWYNPNHVSDLPFAFLLRGGPILFLILWIFYGFLIWLLLGKLTLLTSMVVIVGLLFIHLMGLFKVSRCGFHALHEVPGVTGCYAYGYIPIILVCITLGLILLRERLPKQLTAWCKRMLMSFAIIWICLMGYGIYRSAFPPVSPWKPLAPLHSPGPRTMSAIAFDTKRNRAVLFGGITSWDGDHWVYDATTWEWDGKDWKEISTAVAPAGRILHAMAYDEKRGRVILYGGKNLSGNLADLWEWDGVTWHRLCPVCNPAARFSHKMIFNTERKEMIIYGGQDGKVGLAEGWTWNGEGWTYFQFAESSPGAYNAPLVYDSAGERAIGFMGREWGGTWIWKGDLWQKPNLTIQPPVRDEATLIYDPVRNVSILFGGTNEDKFLYDDTWIFKEDKWTQLDTPTFPSQRSKAVAFYDPVRGSMILYGGEVFGLIYGDMWELTLPPGEQ